MQSPPLRHRAAPLLVLGAATLLLLGAAVRPSAARQSRSVDGTAAPLQRAAAARTRPMAGVTDGPFMVEYYYRVRWGHQAEFLRLFRKNHLPVLERQVQLGSMSSYTAVEPFYHAPDQARWDYRVTIVYPSAAVAHAPDPAADPAFRRALFPDTATFAAEERRRFELLEAHWDVPVVPLALK